MGVFSAKYFSRRFLFVVGHFTMGISHCVVGLSFQLKMPTLTLVAMCAFIFFYANSSGCITWLYCSEVSVDIAFGIIGMSGFICTFVLSLVT
jgi:hypothetical protein